MRNIWLMQRTTGPGGDVGGDAGDTRPQLAPIRAGSFGIGLTGQGRA